LEFGNAAADVVVDEVSPGGVRVRRFRREFWTSAQRQGHSLHEVSYRACFKAELPRYFIELLTEPGDVVYDPFMGRGTTLIEAALLGRAPAGNDVNPLSQVLVRPRLEPPEQSEVEGRLEAIPLESGHRAEIDLSMFFSPTTERQVVALRMYLLERAASGAEDGVDRWIRMVATNRLTGHSTGFFSVYTLPPNQATSQEAQRRINERRSQTPPDRDVRGIIARKSRSLLRGVSRETRARLGAMAARAVLLCQDAREAVPLAQASVGLVVTSPPFLNVVQYAKDNWLRCWFNGIDAESVGAGITAAPSVEAWASVMTGALSAVARVLRPGGWVAFEVGEVRGGTVLLDEIVAPLGPRVGLEPRAIVVNEQEFTKTAHCWGVSNNRGGTNTNRIVLFEKSAG
jgi:hypothetical protein